MKDEYGMIWSDRVKNEYKKNWKKMEILLEEITTLYKDTQIDKKRKLKFQSMQKAGMREWNKLFDEKYKSEINLCDLLEKINKIKNNFSKTKILVYSNLSRWKDSDWLQKLFVECLFDDKLNPSKRIIYPNELKNMEFYFINNRQIKIKIKDKEVNFTNFEFSKRPEWEGDGTRGLLYINTKNNKTINISYLLKELFERHPNCPKTKSDIIEWLKEVKKFNELCDLSFPDNEVEKIINKLLQDKFLTLTKKDNTSYYHEVDEKLTSFSKEQEEQIKKRDKLVCQYQKLEQIKNSHYIHHIGSPDQKPVLCVGYKKLVELGGRATDDNLLTLCKEHLKHWTLYNLCKNPDWFCINEKTYDRTMEDWLLTQYHVAYREINKDYWYFDFFLNGKVIKNLNYSAWFLNYGMFYFRDLIFRLGKIWKNYFNIYDYMGRYTLNASVILIIFEIWQFIFNFKLLIKKNFHLSSTSIENKKINIDDPIFKKIKKFRISISHPQNVFSKEGPSVPVFLKDFYPWVILVRDFPLNNLNIISKLYHIKFENKLNREESSIFYFSIKTLIQVKDFLKEDFSNLKVAEKVEQSPNPWTRIKDEIVKKLKKISRNH